MHCCGVSKTCYVIISIVIILDSKMNIPSFFPKLLYLKMNCMGLRSQTPADTFAILFVYFILSSFITIYIYNSIDEYCS